MSLAFGLNDEYIEAFFKHKKAEAANAYAKELGALFLQPGDHQKELDDIFAKIAKDTSDSFNVFKTVNATEKNLKFAEMAEFIMAKGCVSENKAEIVPVKGQEFHIYTGEPLSALGEVPSGELLCKAIFGESVIIATSGKASYGLLVKDNQYVRMVDIGTKPSETKKIMCVNSLDFYQGDFFTIDNW